jgi:hypothetical protein
MQKEPIDVTTKLEKTLRREISIAGQAYIVTLSPDELVITLKGHRKGKALRWADLVGGEAALATALNASLGIFEQQQATTQAARRTRKRAQPQRRSAPTRRKRQKI